MNVSAKQDALKDDLSVNLQSLKSIYRDCLDVIFRSFSIGGGVQAALVYIERLSNIEEIDKSVLSLLMQQAQADTADVNSILGSALPISGTQEVKTYAEVVDQISSGNPVLLIDRQAVGISVGLAQWEKRAVQEPTSESTVRGPRDGFTETLTVNTSLLRRKIKQPN